MIIYCNQDTVHGPPQDLKRLNLFVLPQEPIHPSFSGQLENKYNNFINNYGLRQNFPLMSTLISQIQPGFKM